MDGGGAVQAETIQPRLIVVPESVAGLALRMVPS